MDELHSWYLDSLLKDFNENFDEKSLISRLIRVLKSIKAMKEDEMAKLSEEQIEELNRRKDEPIKKLAKEFGVSTQAITYHRGKENKRSKAKKQRPKTAGKAEERVFVKITEKHDKEPDSPLYPYNNQVLDEKIRILEECKKLNTAVDIFANEMKAKLHTKAEKGITGWDNADDDSSKQYIQRLFTGRLEKQKEAGNQEVDLANYIMFPYFINNPGMLTK